MGKGLVSAVVVVSVSLGIAGCTSEPVQSICNDAPKFERAISEVNAENADYKAELLGDVAEYAADTGNCPAYAGQGEEDE